MTTRGLTFTGPSIPAMMTCAQCGVLSPGICPECGSPEKLKSMTRRVAKTQPVFVDGQWRWYFKCEVDYAYFSWAKDAPPYRGVAGQAPHQPGDIVYAKEALRAFTKRDSNKLASYNATITPVPYAPGAREGWFGQATWQWKRNVLPSRFMPRWAARIWREVLEVRAERVQDISAEDIRAEGIDAWCDNGIHDPGDALRTAFRALWDSLHAKRHGGAHVWKENPLVFVYTLKVIDPVGDALRVLDEHAAEGERVRRTSEERARTAAKE